MPDHDPLPESDWARPSRHQLLTSTASQHPVRFSIIVPTRDSPTLAETLESLRAQQYAPDLIEIVVVGRSNETPSGGTPAIRFIRPADALPPSAARNLGARETRGEVLVFIDSDCVAEPDWLARLATHFTHSSVCVVGGGVAIRPRSYWNLADNISLFHDFLASQPPGVRPFLPSLNLAIRRAAFSAACGFNEGYSQRPSAEDVDLTIRLRNLGHKLHFDPRAVVWHASSRARLADAVRRAYHQGRDSIKVDPRYRGTPDSLPQWMHHRPVLIAAAPLAAAAVTTRIFLGDAGLWRWAYAAPGVFLLKMAWCMGAAYPAPLGPIPGGHE